jgi:very-short-patch-repair endonuclease
MSGRTPQPSHAEAWTLAERQHDVISRNQLLALGFTRHAINHRLDTGRLHPVFRGVYAVGRPRLSRLGHWMAAILACGQEAVLSHRSAAALWGILPAAAEHIDVSLPAPGDRRRPGVVVHRRQSLTQADVTRHHRIPVTTIVATLIDVAPGLTRGELEGATSAADKLDLIDPEALRTALEHIGHRPGAPKLRDSLDRHTYVMTDTELERRLLPIARRAGLPIPLTQVYVNGYKADFYFPDLGMLIETDGLRYHRTPAQQAEDRRRDQAHTAAGLVPLRFTRAQVRFEPGHVEEILTAVARRLRQRQRPGALGPY